jgi:hypothetical protein
MEAVDGKKKKSRKERLAEQRAFDRVRDLPVFVWQ